MVSLDVELANKIQAARKHLGLTAKEAAAAWKISPRTLESWEQGLRTPRGLALVALEQILNDVLTEANLKWDFSTTPTPPANTPKPPKAKRRRRAR